ncbi:hypothetical protein ACH5RR_023742 [Cinchona calisaya]|uniref:Uncharacterized protein n=1 Tax=Cinchona calisaya TaxID=153742 RepID=A0ABD2ZEZ3_9GENT
MENTSRWVDFKYKKCLDFCCNCEIIGYSERSCSIKNIRKEGSSIPQFGGRLKANFNRSAVSKNSTFEDEGRDDMGDNFNKQDQEANEVISGQVKNSVQDNMEVLSRTWEPLNMWLKNNTNADVCHLANKADLGAVVMDDKGQIITTWAAAKDFSGQIAIE